MEESKSPSTKRGTKRARFSASEGAESGGDFSDTERSRKRSRTTQTSTVAGGGSSSLTIAAQLDATQRDETKLILQSAVEIGRLKQALAQAEAEEKREIEQRRQDLLSDRATKRAALAQYLNSTGDRKIVLLPLDTEGTTFLSLAERDKELTLLSEQLYDRMDPRALLEWAQTWGRVITSIHADTHRSGSEALLLAFRELGRLDLFLCGGTNTASSSASDLVPTLVFYHRLPREECIMFALLEFLVRRNVHQSFTRIDGVSVRTDRDNQNVVHYRPLLRAFLQDPSLCRMTLDNGCIERLGARNAAYECDETTCVLADNGRMDYGPTNGPEPGWIDNWSVEIRSFAPQPATPARSPSPARPPSPPGSPPHEFSLVSRTKSSESKRQEPEQKREDDQGDGKPWTVAENALFTQLLEERGHNAPAIAKEWVRHVNATKFVHPRSLVMIENKLADEAQNVEDAIFGVKAQAVIDSLPSWTIVAAGPAAAELEQEEPEMEGTDFEAGDEGWASDVEEIDPTEWRGVSRAPQFQQRSADATAVMAGAASGFGSLVGSSSSLPAAVRMDLSSLDESETAVATPTPSPSSTGSAAGLAQAGPPAPAPASIAIRALGDNDFFLIPLVVVQLVPVWAAAVEQTQHFSSDRQAALSAQFQKQPEPPRAHGLQSLLVPDLLEAPIAFVDFNVRGEDVKRGAGERKRSGKEAKESPRESKQARGETTEQDAARQRLLSFDAWDAVVAFLIAFARHFETTAAMDRQNGEDPEVIRVTYTLQAALPSQLATGDELKDPAARDLFRRLPLDDVELLDHVRRIADLSALHALAELMEIAIAVNLRKPLVELLP
jgi:hypothetical protein